MKNRALAALVVIFLLAALYQDASVQRFMKSLYPSARVAALAPPDVQRFAPPDVQRYAEAFCRADTTYVAAHTRIPGVDETIISEYFADDPPCSSARYMGMLTDAGAARYIFVLTFAEGREDYVIFTWDGSLTGLSRG